MRPSVRQSSRAPLAATVDDSVAHRDGETSGIATHSDARLFVIRQHATRAAHYELNLELDGVLRSWAVPKGPSANPADKRFALELPDRPLEHAELESPSVGPVIVWDRGMWRSHGDFHAGFGEGKLLFDLVGYKVRGRWTLVRMKSKTDDSPGKEWLLIKERDAYASDTHAYDEGSVLSGLAAEDFADPTRWVNAFAERIAQHPAVKRRDEPLHPRAFEPAPMLAIAGDPFDRDGWVFEIKYDGYRLFAAKQGAQLELVSRNGLRLTQRFPEVARTIAALPIDHLLIDGEIVVHDAQGRPSFGRLQERIALTSLDQVEHAARHRPATYYAFDLVEACGFRLDSAPLVDRKAWLETVLPRAGAVRYSAHVASAGRATFAASRRLGLEGVVGKRAASEYVTGRSSDWVKVRARRTGEFVIVGWVPVKTTGRDIGAVALAEYRNGALTYVGRAGSGLNAALRGELARALAHVPPGDPLTRDAELRWVAPHCVCEVEFREYTRDGHLRQPVFLRLRDDKAPGECIGRFEDVESRGAESRELPTTHRDKIFFPEKGLTKGDVIDYYATISPWMLRYLHDRPVVITRFPDGIHGKSFYQHEAPDDASDWLQLAELPSARGSRTMQHMIVRDARSLAYLANLGTLPIHAWHARITHPDRPDWCVLDLDPKEASFERVIEAAKRTRELCDELGWPAYAKTSGASGLHVLLPLGSQLTHDQARTVAGLLARVLAKRYPDLVTTQRSVRRRGARVYVDWMQNGRGRLLVAPFSLRAEAAASVSMPVRWNELNGRLANEKHHIGNAVARMRRLKGDPLAPVLTDAPDLRPIFERLAALLRSHS